MPTTVEGIPIDVSQYTFTVDPIKGQCVYGRFPPPNPLDYHAGAQIKTVCVGNEVGSDKTNQKIVLLALVFSSATIIWGMQYAKANNGQAPTQKQTQMAYQEVVKQLGAKISEVGACDVEKWNILYILKKVDGAQLSQLKDAVKASCNAHSSAQLMMWLLIGLGSVAAVLLAVMVYKMLTR